MYCNIINAPITIYLLSRYTSPNKENTFVQQQQQQQQQPKKNIAWIMVIAW
jgi:hypothetical protein